MVGSSTTTLFQIRRQRNNTGTYYIKLLFITLLLGMLAYLASRNAVLCVLLNFTVPFALVFFQSDQFAPKGYFGYAMTFVFLELRPPTPEEFPVQMLCLLFCTLVLIGALLLYAFPGSPTVYYGDEAGMQGYEDPLNRRTGLPSSMVQQGNFTFFPEKV